MPAADKQNTRKKQLKKKPKMVPHGPGGQMLRPAPKAKPKPRPVVKAPAGDAAGGYNLRPAKKIAAKREKQQRQREHEAKDTKSSVDLHAGDAVKRSRDYEQARAEARQGRYRTASPALRKRLFGKPSKDTKNPVVLERYKRAERAGALIDGGAIPALLLKNAADAATSVPDIAKATYHHPGKVGGSTAKSLPGLAAATIAGIADVPIKVAQGKTGDLAKTLREDNRRRYDQTSKQKQKRYTEEGVASEVIDLAPAAVGAGAIAGDVAGAAARVGKLGKPLQKVAGTSRPKLRRAAGDGGAVEQDLSSNLIKAATQKAVDRGRKKKHAKRAGKVDQGGEAVPVRGLVPGEGEVVKKRLVLQRRDQRIDVSRNAARGHEAQKRAQDREVRAGVEKERRKLSKHDKRIETLALQGLIHFDDAKTTERLLSDYRARIVKARDAEHARVTKAGGTPHRIPKKSDEVARIDETLARLKNDPSSVIDLTAEVRRYQPLGRVLGHDAALDASLARIDAKLAAGDFGAKTSAAAASKATVLKDRARRQFVTRVQARAEELGLPEPVYVGHRPRSKAQFSAFSAGGAKAIQAGKRSEYKLFDQGRADTTGAAYSDALAQGIKRNINWNTVSDTFERHTPEWGRNMGSEELAKAIDDRNLAPGDWRVVDLGRFRRTAKDAGKTDDVGVQGDKGVHDAVRATTYTLDGIPAEFARAKLSLVPKGVADELEAMTRPSGKIGRTAQKVQGLQSKLILGTNPTFVPVQASANALQTALATNGNLVDVLKGHKVWKTLDQPTKDWVESRVGVSSVSDASNFRPRYGALNNESSALIHNWRVFKDSRPVQGVKTSRVNPLNWNARLDDLQNNFFRHVTTQAAISKEARQLARRMGDTRTDAAPLVKVLQMPDGPEKLEALRKAEPQIDKVAEHVNGMLGDYSRFTARERKFARTTLLFYPFLRWALKFTFYTLPIKHPMAAALTAKLGQLHREEVVGLLGEEIRRKHGGSQKDAEKLVRKFAPSYAYGRVYFDKDKLQSIDFSRINPLATQALDVIPQEGEAGLVHGGLKTALGSLSPLGVSILKASQGRDPSTGLPLNVGGSKTPFGQSPRMTTGRELGVIGRDLINLNAPARNALKIKDKGVFQGDDLSNITGNLSANDIKKSKARADAQGSTKEATLDAAIPFRKKTDLGAETIYRHAISDELKKIAERKSRFKKGTPPYKELTAKESDLKRKIGALPPKKSAGGIKWGDSGGSVKWSDKSSGVKWPG